MNFQFYNTSEQFQIYRHEINWTVGCWQGKASSSLIFVIGFNNLKAESSFHHFRANAMSQAWSSRWCVLAPGSKYLENIWQNQLIWDLLVLYCAYKDPSILVHHYSRKSYSGIELSTFLSSWESCISGHFPGFSIDSIGTGPLPKIGISDNPAWTGFATSLSGWVECTGCSSHV